MRFNSTVLVVTAVVLSVVATAGVAAALAPAGTDVPTRQIQVSTTGEVSAQPDRAIVRVAVVATADDAATARDRVASNVSDLRATLAALDVPDDRIETVHFDIGQQRDRPETGASGAYRAVHAVEITLTDTDRVGDVIDGVVDSGANRVQGVSFTLSPDRRQQLRQQALERAMDRAREEAGTLASSANLTITGAAAISTEHVAVRPYRVEQAMTADASGAPATRIESGAVDVQASVQVRYNATAA